MLRIEGVIQPYAWGSDSFIPDLLGLERTGEPHAELWLGAHPSAPARVDGRALDELIAEQPEALVGPKSVTEFGPTLPYLLKVLSAAQPLSLQAHPSRAQAEAGFAAEEAEGVPLDAAERTYRDDWPKPEMLCALEDAEVLCGFREPAESYALFSRLKVAAALELVEPLRQGGAPELERVFERTLRLSGSELSVIGEVARAAGGGGDNFARTARELGKRYPDDPGVLAALLMNRLRLHRLDAIYLPAGNLHAYLHGSGIEIMANSNNVLRGGLTSKHVNVDELLKVLDFTPGVPEVMQGVEQPSGVFAYATPAPEFALYRLECRGDPVVLPRKSNGRVVLCVAGHATLRSAQGELALEQGQAAFVLARDREATVEGVGTLFLAAPGGE